MPETTRVRGGQADSSSTGETHAAVNEHDGLSAAASSNGNGHRRVNPNGNGHHGRVKDVGGPASDGGQSFGETSPLGRSDMTVAELDATERILELARDQLNMDVAFVSEFSQGQEVVRLIQGDGGSFGLRREGSLPLKETYSQRMAQGGIRNGITDARTDHRVIDLAPTAEGGVGTYVGVPITFSYGRIYGTLSCLSHDVNPALGERDVRFMHAVALVLAEQLELRDVEWKRRSLQVQRVRRVLGRGELAMAYQPIFDLRSEQPVGVEALARFPAKHPPTPDRWFAEAEKVGLGLELEVLAIQSALESLTELPEHMYLAVNLSPRTVLSSRLRGALGGVPLERVVLELTEHARVEDYEPINRALDRLRDRGARLAIDDVGAGFASLRHILRMAPNIIKLDLALTRDIDSDPVRRAMASSLISFADETGASITAEGIETEGELQTLRSLGVEHGQGFRLAPPAPLQDLVLAG